MFRLEKGEDDYVMESISDMHYTAPDIYNRKVKAVSSTFRRNRGQLADLTDFLNVNFYSSSVMSDKLLSPLNKEASRYYTYELDSVAGPPDNLRYKVSVTPKYEGTQLVRGYVWVSDQVWSVREIYMEGNFDMVEFKMHSVMGREGNEEFLPIHSGLNLIFKFMGNHLEMKSSARIKYKKIRLHTGGDRRKSQKKHHHDLTEFYDLTCDTTRLITDKEKFAELRPYPLTAEEDSLYTLQEKRKKETDAAKQRMPEKNAAEFWGQLGDMLVTNYNVNLSEFGSVRCSPLINPVMLSYSHSRGVSYKQKFKYNKLFPNGRLIRVTPQLGYNFTRKELYVKADMSFMYWPQKQGSVDISVGNGNRNGIAVLSEDIQSESSCST